MLAFLWLESTTTDLVCELILHLNPTGGEGRPRRPKTQRQDQHATDCFDLVQTHSCNGRLRFLHTLVWISRLSIPAVAVIDPLGSHLAFPTGFDSINHKNLHWKPSSKPIRTVEPFQIHQGFFEVPKNNRWKQVKADTNRSLKFLKKSASVYRYLWLARWSGFHTPHLPGSL